MPHITQNIESNIDLEDAMNELLMVLNAKERTIITKRFSLDNEPRQTLESIGKRFSVTRERIRQIEATALKKLQRNAQKSKMKRIADEVYRILGERGGICSEKEIIQESLANIHTVDCPINGHIIGLALAITPDLSPSNSPKMFHSFWYHGNEVTLPEIKTIAKVAYKIAKKKGSVMTAPDLVERTAKQLKLPENDYEKILSAVTADLRFLELKNGKWGLQEWRHINPKTIRDKALIIMRRDKASLHFIEIANAISEEGFDNKPVTVQAVHNDLIRYPEFVLVGRGVYALREWGYNPGTVSDVIAAILKKDGPLSKKEIIKKVQEQRDVKIGTISLNLQKEAAFIRVGRAVYDFDEAQWNPKKSGRGRKKKAIIDELEKNAS